MSEVSKWLNKISKSEKEWQKYHDLIKDIRDYYLNEKKSNKQNIFWSSIETLKPFIYLRHPFRMLKESQRLQTPLKMLLAIF